MVDLVLYLETVGGVLGEVHGMELLLGERGRRVFIGDWTESTSVKTTKTKRTIEGSHVEWGGG